LFKAQRAMGYEPFIVTSPKHEDSWPGPRASKETINDFVYYRSGRVRHLPVPIARELWLMYVLYKRILEIAGKEKPDILHAHSPVLNAIPAIWVARKFGLPIVYEIRAFWEDAAVDHGTYAEGSWKYRLTRFIETRVCSKVDHVSILCNGLKTDLIRRRIPAEKITPVFNGVDIDDFKPCSADPDYLREWKLTGKEVIGFIGSFFRYEGLDLLVKSFARVAKDHPDAVLLLVGEGEMESELARLITELDLDSRVVMPGRIPHERVPGVYALIDVLAYPRYSMRLTELVTPLKPLEAMAMGKALVASDVGGHRELICHADTGLLFRAGDESALAEQITLLLVDHELREALQRKSRAWVQQNHSWERTTDVYRKIYSSLRKDPM